MASASPSPMARQFMGGVLEDDRSPDENGSSSSGEEDMDRAEEEVAKILIDDMLAEAGLTPQVAEATAARAAGEPGAPVSTGAEDQPTHAVLRFLDDPRMMIFLMVATFLALFGEDFKVLCFSPSVDDYWSWQTFIVFIIFSIEFLANCCWRKNYMFSLFFWLDLLATVSLISDIKFMNDEIFGPSDNVAVAQLVCQASILPQDGLGASEGGVIDEGNAARAGRAARGATRSVRLIRIVRVLRVLRIFKVLHFFGGFGAQTDEDDELELRSNPTKIGKRLAEKMSQRLILVVLLLFVSVVVCDSFNFVEDRGELVGLNLMDTLRFNNGTADATTGWVQHYAANMFVWRVEKPILCLKDRVGGGHLFRHDPEALSDRRDNEITLVWSDSNKLLCVLDAHEDALQGSWVSLCMMLTILIVMIAANWVFSHDTEELVVGRISVMIASVNKMSETLVFLKGDDQDDDEKMETAQIEKAFDKMSTLLRIGFGAAGNAVISKSLMESGELNAMIPGQHVTAVFGFCDIRGFGELTDVLRGQIMPFVNLLAQIVHTKVDAHQGAPNKNIGEAFLSVWKTEAFEKTPRGRSPQSIKLLRRLSMAPAHSPSGPMLSSLGGGGGNGGAGSSGGGLNWMELTANAASAARESATTHSAREAAIRAEAAVTKGGGDGDDDDNDDDTSSSSPQQQQLRLSPFQGAVGRVKSKWRQAASPTTTTGSGDWSGGGNGNGFGGGNGDTDDEYTSKADEALLAFTDVIREIRSQRTELLLRKKHPRLYMKFPQFKLDMGFGLHHGWAIEGAIGSMHKVDVSYLSPHVNMSARLESASKQYNVPLLLSGTFASLLSANSKKRCRKVDRVKLVGSDKIMELWTCDEPRISARTKEHRQFGRYFTRGVEQYIKGSWDTACIALRAARKILPEDGPTLTLLAQMQRMGGGDSSGATKGAKAPVAPDWWQGWHKLGSK